MTIPRTFNLEHGRKYWARISLSFPKSMASDAAVADELAAHGFTEVTAWGSGGDRTATGTWSGETQTVALPSEIVDVRVYPK